MKKIKISVILLISLFCLIINVKAYDKTIDDGVYVIHSKVDENYVMDVYLGKASNKSNVQLYKTNEGINQKFIIKYRDDGYYEITSAIDDNFSLDANQAVFNNSVNVQLYQKNNSSAQKWIIKKYDGYYKICSYNENYCVDVNGAVAYNGNNIQLWESNDSNAQKFIFEKISDLKKTIEPGVYTISSKLSNDFTLDIYNNEYKNTTNVQLYKKGAGENQMFYVSYTGNGYYTIRSYFDINYVLDVHNAGKTNETNVEIYKSNGGNNQQWIIQDSGDGYYHILSKCNYLALDVYKGNAQNGANIQMYTAKDSDNQKFKFDKIQDNGIKSIMDGYYFINTILNNKKVVDVNQANMEPSTNVQIYDLNYGMAQKWYIKYIKDGYYAILCDKDNNYSLQVDGANINIGKYENNDNQKWFIRKSSNGYYILSKNGQYVDLTGLSTSNKTNIQIHEFNGGNAQKFNFIKTASGISERILDDGIYRISSALNKDMFVDVNGAKPQNKTNIQLWSRNTSLAQKFKIEYLSNGYYKISTLVDLTKSIDVEGASSANGTNALIYDSGNGINQQWIIKSAGDGYFYIISNCGNLYLDVSNGQTSNGTNILLWEYNGGKNQKFKFIKSEEKTRVMDVSYHQGSIDWNKVSNSGIYGVILRIGYWSTEDEKFKEYINEVKRLEIPYGIYLFSYASTTNGANIEANFTKDMIRKYNLNPTLGIYYDIEDWYTNTESSKTLTKPQYDNIINTYVNSVSSYVSSKYKVKVYASTNYIDSRLSNNVKGYVDWVADYRGYCGYSGSYSLWQYTSSATIDGVHGYVDMSYLK